MSSRRKTLLGNELPQFEVEEEVDDIAEKRRRLSIHQNDPSVSTILQRKNRIVQENHELTRANSLNGSSRVSNNQQTPQVPKPSNEQLSCLYNNCVKLLNENKINVKNAFQLKLIDYMSDIVLNKEIVGGVTNFQVVGCTIDVGTKIYAARVDALHQNTYQMLDGIRRSGNEDDSNENDLTQTRHELLNEVEEDLNPDEDQSKKNKAKKKRIKKSSQIAENLETISSKLRDDFQDEDLYFSKISTCIENEAIGGILLNKLHYINDTNEILINKDEKINTVKSNLIISEDMEINLKDLFMFYKNNKLDLKNLKLCSEMNNFRFIGWNLDSEDEISKFVENMNNMEDNLEAHRFDANNRHSQLNLSNENNIGVDIDDEDYINNVMEMDDNLGAELNGTLSNKMTSIQQSGLEIFEKIDDIRSLNSIADLTTLISNSPSEYSYFNFEKLKLHDLPKHLKRMAVQIATQNNINKENSELGSQLSSVLIKQSKSNTARNKKEAPRIDFTIQTDISKFYKITKKAIFLCDKTLEKRSEKSIKIETERQYNYNSKELFQAYSKPITAKIFSDIEPVENLLLNEDIEIGKASAKKQNNQVDDDDAHLGGIDDDFEIPCTAQTNEPFFSQNGHEFAQSQQINGMNINMDMESHNDLGAMPILDGDNLIQAPLQVNALNIEYAKTSKNIDVRRLKQVIWAILSDCNDKENIDENLNETGSDKRINQKLSINASLKEIYNQLKPPVISQKVYDDLSICIVFQMLLFLANEHNLLLKNDPIGSDVIITNY